MAELRRAGWRVEVVDGAAGSGEAIGEAAEDDRLVLVTADRRAGDPGHHGWVDRLAAVARVRLDRTPFAVVVIVGGETAAAILGPEPIQMIGTMGAGIAVGRWAEPGGPLLVTKPGGFGGAGALRDLFGTKMVP